VALVGTVTRRALPIEISTVGSLRSPETTIISADISGIIVELDAPEGREIGEGHLIARLDDQETRAALQVAEARERNARIALERAEPLVRDGVVPQQQLDDAEADVAMGVGLLEEARTRLDKTRIRAPFGGLVGIQTAQLGQYVSSGDPIIELTQIDVLELVFGVPEEQAASVHIGQVVQGRVGRCGVAFEALVEALDPQIDRDSRTRAVQAKVDNSARQLIPGMSARVRIEVGRRDSKLVIPREALVAQGARFVAWVVKEDGTVQSAPVTPGAYLPDVVEIVSGLEDGQKVVVAGHQKLRPGARIAEQPWVETVNENLARGVGVEDECEGD
jgi:membrane fusion protein (multidrug efflux system)